MKLSRTGKPDHSLKEGPGPKIKNFHRHQRDILHSDDHQGSVQPKKDDIVY